MKYSKKAGKAVKSSASGIKKSRKTKSHRLRLKRNPATGQLQIVGRPAWSTRSKRIKVNQIASKGELEDRRHLLHWDEHLKPILASVFNAMAREYPADLYGALTRPLVTRKWRAIPKSAEAVMLRVSGEINGAEANLVPDRADINKAIEHVRANLRVYAESLKGNPQFVSDTSALPADSTRMGAYKHAARARLSVGDTSTPIRARMSEIHSMILEQIDGCEAPCSLWRLIHDLQYSVTFDLSSKATREKSGKVLAWQRMMLKMEHLPAADRYEALLSLLD